MSSSKQYGSRYGVKPRRRIEKIFKLKEQSTKCPFCLKHSVKRIAAGIWYCTACNTKFTGGAYTYNPKDFKMEVKEADFLKEKEEKEEENLLEGFDEEQEVDF